MTESFTIARILVDELRARSVDHVFGIPGDFALGLFKVMEDSPLALINTCD